MKHKFILALLLAASSYASAATINVGGVISAATGIVATSPTYGALSNGGYYIGVGSFDTVPVIAPGTTDISSFVNSMNVFATATSPTLAGNTKGTIVGSFVSLGGANPSAFNLKQIYFTVGNAATKLLSTQWAIFTTATNIAFPADVTASTAVTVSLGSIANSVMVANAGTEIDNVSPVKDGIMFGALATTPYPPVPEPTAPEPSAALLGALGALSLLRRRRN